MRNYKYEWYIINFVGFLNSDNFISEDTCVFASIGWVGNDGEFIEDSMREAIKTLPADVAFPQTAMAPVSLIVIVLAEYLCEKDNQNI